ncbi:TPA: EAL domain-containing protein [Photobacterium damselae]
MNNFYLYHKKYSYRFISPLIELRSMSNIKVVAECVETPEEREILEQLNIDYLQGYLIHKPALF